MNDNKQKVAVLGANLLKKLKNIRCKINVKSKTSIFSQKSSDTSSYEIEELILRGAKKLLSMPKKSYDKKTDGEELLVKRECDRYLQAVDALPMETREKLKVSKVEQYIQNDFNNVHYKDNFFKKIIMSEFDERKSILLAQIIEDIEWNNTLLQK